MSTEIVRELRTFWQTNERLARAVETAFEYIGFDNAYVEVCIAAAKGGQAERKTKHIKDNIWGMIELDYRAMRLLDCPVIQRLRGIKQLGISYLTYPSAEHSRFSHSMGMACVVSRFLTSIEKRPTENEDGSVDNLLFVGIEQLAPVKPADIVDAAILHDVGHMPFSHASEKILEGLDESFTCGDESVAEFRAAVAQRLRKRLDFSEALSLLIVLSKRFCTFYDEYVRVGDEDPDALLRIACLIAGLSPEPHLSGVPELISSAAVDADKIDYVNRDAHACGIPVGVDVSRVFLRSGFIRANRDHLIKAGLKPDPAPHEILFVINASGMDTVDEITQARAALYQRVYLHAVTRGAEALLGRTLAANIESPSKDPELADALGLWPMSDDALLAKLIRASDSEIVRLGRRITNRQLLKKACVFSSSVASMHMPLQYLLPRITNAIMLKKQVANTPLEELSVQKLAMGKDRELEKEIVAEANRLVEKLPFHSRQDFVPKSSLRLITVVGTSYMERVRKDCIVLQNGELLRTAQFTNIREQQDAFDIFKAVGYVMCEPEWRPIVLTAARTVLSRPIGPPLPTLLSEGKEESEDGLIETGDEVVFLPRAILDLKGVIRRSGVRRQTVRALMQAAEEGGYFDDKPLLAEPTDPGSEAVRKVAQRLATFEGHRSWRVRRETVASFIDQFPPRLRQEMLRALAQIIFFDSAELKQSVLDLTVRLDSQPMDIVPLSANSGPFVRLTIEREAEGRSAYAHLHFRKTITEALADTTDRPIVLVDDNISSATQARAQFLRWAGAPRENWPEECRGEDGIFDEELTPDQLERMRQRPIYVVCSVGRPTAETNLRPVTDKLGFRAFRGVQWKHPVEHVIEWSTELQDYLHEVGLRTH